MRGILQGTRSLPRRFCTASQTIAKPKPSVVRRVAKGFAAAAGACGGLTLAAYKTGALGWIDEGSERSLKFWSAVFPIYLQYELVQQRYKHGWITYDESLVKYEALHDYYTDFIRDLTYEMRGFYLKNAQIMSTRDEFVPPQYLVWCKETQDNCPTEFTTGEARAEAEKQLGRPLDELFERWDDDPLAVASIGEVHGARLRPETMASLAAAGYTIESPEVVIKIQLPNIEKRFRADIKTIIAFCTLAMPQHVPPMAEIEKQFLTEFDYLLEAANMEQVRANLLKSNDLQGRCWAERISIPAPLTPLCTRGVLVMERMPGVPLVKGLKNQFSAIAQSQGKSLAQLQAETKAKIEEGLLKRLSLAEDAAQFQQYNRMLRVKRWATAPLRCAWNWTVGLAAGQWELESVGAGPNGELLSLGSLLQTLVDVHAHEILVDGCFNGDPHPGNVMLLPDGRLGLIDYGQVKHISLGDRKAYARLIVALDERNQEEASLRGPSCCSLAVLL